MTRLLLVLLLLLSFLVRLYRLDTPDRYIFDEVYHAVTAKLYAKNDPSGYEWWHPAPEPNTAIEWLHPPVAKLTQALGILVLGEQAIAWRIPSVFFGVGVIWLTYLLAKRISGRDWIGLIAATLVAVDGLLFVQSRVAMNDIHITFFYALSVLMYLQFRDAVADQRKTKKNLQEAGIVFTQKPPIRELLFTGLSVGLAISTKWSGFFLIGLMFGDQIYGWIRSWRLPSVLNFLRLIAFWLLLPAAVYVGSYAQFWLQGHTWQQFSQLHNQILRYQTSLDATHPYQSTPIEWILNLRPVWIAVDYQEGQVAQIYNVGNPVLFWLGALVMLWIFILTLRSFDWTRWFLFAAYGSSWVLWLFSPRIMFFYHYAPAVPFLAVAVAWWIGTLQRYRNIVMISVLALAVMWFVVFFPHLSGMFVPTGISQALYYWFSSWR